MAKLNFEQFVNLRILLEVEGIGPAKVRSLLAHLKSVTNILEAPFDILMEAEGISKVLAQRILRVKQQRESILKKVESEFRILEKTGAKTLTIWDDEYPGLLKKIYDPPLILYYKGSFSEFDKYCIAIVGTRIPTNYGKAQAELFAASLAEQNITIVSGLARGIDSIAHRAVLKKGGRTIAVTGSGIDVIYPPENKRLYEEISEKGLVITEYEPGKKPDAVNFPKRNRIISGLSMGVIIIETGVTGGAMQTATFALDQNKEVFAVPGNLGIRQSEGTNTLIQRSNAKLIISPEDVLTELNLKLKPLLKKEMPRPDVDLNIFEQKIIDQLCSEPKQIDKISELCALSISDCLVNLLTLEFKGLVRQYPGKMFSLI